MFTPGSVASNDAGLEAMRGPRDFARIGRSLKEAGYGGERLVFMGATDVPSLNAFSKVSADLFRRMAFDIDYQTTDWGTIVQRRLSQEPPGRGGWNSFCNYMAGYDAQDPITNTALNAVGRDRNFGWVDTFIDDGTLEMILSEASIEKLRADLRAGEGLSGPTEQWMPEAPQGCDPGHTTSFSIADATVNIACVTQSLESGFGSGIVVSGTGICLMAPSISTRDGKPVLALGTPGSYGILQAQAQAIVNRVDFGMGLQDAIDAPRGRVWDGRRTEFEDRFEPSTISGLVQLGHDASFLPSGWLKLVGGMQAVSRSDETGLFTGAADRRRDGQASGL